MKVWTSLDWLTARPIAHRGLHDAARGVIENTAGAARAAIAGGYGIEVDVQVSADGEAMVHHDDVLGRLTEGEGRLDAFTAAQLKRVPFRGSDERMMTLGDLCDLVGGRVTMLVELKSRFDGDGRLPVRVAAVLDRYRGPVAAMSFDPRQLALLRQESPRLVRGIIAAKYRPHPYW
ncbi:MAG: glycerophosphodiester phosphodiesterase family protein, partial [Xanthobacteraceae bacterium]